jgi:hypothetical protein
MLVVHHAKTFLCCARNAPKYHYSRLHGARVVAQPIQDSSAVSITNQAVGVGLPRLRRGEIELSLFPSCRFGPTRVSSSFPFFLHGGRGVRLSGVFESALKRWV